MRPPAPKLPTKKRSHSLLQAIIHEDDALIVLNKPAGMAVHGGHGQSLGVIEAMRKLRPELPYLELVHRLDRETSGCLLIAKKRPYLRLLNEAISKRQIKKVYHAILVGTWQGPKHRIVREPLLKENFEQGQPVRVDKAGKEARTDFFLEQQCQGHCLVRVHLFTGRTHQIRVHAQSIGLPIVGDKKYGKALSSTRLMLHAERISVPALGSRAAFTWTAPKDTEWQAFMS